MVNELLKIFKIGRKVGLSKKEITRVLIFDNSKYAYLWRILLIIFMLLIFIGWYSSLAILTIKINENVYPSNALYSTIKLNNFNKKFHLI